MALSPYSGSIAARPRVRVGGMRGKTEDPAAFRARMDGQSATPISAAQQQPTAVSPAANPLPNRRDNILAARADGTFDAKRATYNQQGQATGHSMDEAGNITAPPPAVKPTGQLVPGSRPGSSVWQPTPSTAAKATLSAPATAPAGQPAAPTAARPGPLMRPVGKINGMPAPLAIEQARNPVTNNVTRDVTPPVTPPSPSHPALSSTDDLATQRRAQIQSAIAATQGPAAAARRAGPQPAAPLPNNQIMTPDVAKKALQHNSAVPGYGQALASISDAAYNAKWKAEHGPRLAPYHGQPFSAAATGSIATRPPIKLAGIPGRAEGGPVQAQRPYLVGERGPEIIVPKTAGTVIPNHMVNPTMNLPDLPPKAEPHHVQTAVHLGRAPTADWRTSSRPKPLATKGHWARPAINPAKVATNLIVAR